MHLPKGALRSTMWVTDEFIKSAGKVAVKTELINLALVNLNKELGDPGPDYIYEYNHANDSIVLYSKRYKTPITFLRVSLMSTPYERRLLNETKNPISN